CRHEPSPTGLSTLSLHDALPISKEGRVDDDTVPCFEHRPCKRSQPRVHPLVELPGVNVMANERAGGLFRTQSGEALALHIRAHRSEEHTSELQSRENLVCRLLLE